MATDFRNVGAYVSTTDILDPALIYRLDLNSDEFRNFLVRIRQSLNNISMSLNLKDTGYYTLDEFVCGQLYFRDPALSSTSGTMPKARNVYRIVVIFGALPNTATKTVAHGLTPTADWKFTRIFGSATDPINLKELPLPFASPILINNIELSVDATNITITTAKDYSAYTNTTVVLEYTKN